MAGLLRELFRERVDLGDGEHLDALIAPASESHQPDWAILFVERGFTGDLTDKAGHKRHYQDGKEVKGREDPAGGGTGGSASGGGTGSDAQPTRADVTPGLAEKLAKVSPEIATKPGLMAKLGDACVTAAAKANLFLFKHSEKLDTIGTVLGAVLDTPDDMKKFGYQPSMSGQTATAAAGKAMDPMQDLSGGLMSTHLACTVASHALAAAFNFAKKKVGAKKEGIDGDVYDLCAELLHQVLTAVNEQMGLEGVPDVAAIAGKLRELHQAK